MSFDVEQYAMYNIANAVVHRYPFPHFYARPIFPEDYYRELLARLPAPGDGVYVPIDETGTVPKGAYRERHICSLNDLEGREAEAQSGSFWAELSSWLMSERFADLIMRMFKAEIEQRFGRHAFLRIKTECRFVRDHTNYSITPHTDSPSKLVSLLFYLPRDMSKRHLGTSIYVPRDPEFRCPKGTHYEFGLFKHVARMDYMPNSLFAFLKTDRAFHGVEPIADHDVQRDAMLYNIYVKKVVKKPDQAGFRWPWQRR